MPLRPFILLNIAAVCIWFATPDIAEAQAETRVQAGAAVAPGVGVQVGIIPQRRWYSIEAIGQGSHRPPFLGGEYDWHVSAGFGAALRIMGAVDFVMDRSSPHEIDLGLRLGPGLQFKPDETIAEQNRRFFLLLEPFMRYAFQTETGYIFFVEVGAQQPFLRLGLWFTL